MEVVEFFNFIKCLGREKTVNVIGKPMWHGCGSGGVLNPQSAKSNLREPGKTTRLRHSSGYTAKSGVVKPWLHSFLQLANDHSLAVKPLVETAVVMVIGEAMGNDSTTIKPTIHLTKTPDKCRP